MIQNIINLFSRRLLKGIPKDTPQWVIDDFEMLDTLKYEISKEYMEMLI